MRRLLLAALATALAGCPDSTTAPYAQLYAITAVPPGSVASIVTNRDDARFQVSLSVGVAIGARCSDYCPGTRTTCASMRVTSDDPGVLDVRSVYRGGRQPTESILVAKKVGTTTLVVDTACATEVYTVDVLPRP
ncbi:MAG: hypothetical protein KF773_13845 [Deltaproteobacteria bacterium]|nr:hypothetical protein [Deltaproteobacteria bacterium]